MEATLEILTADEAWVALALLHRRYPDRIGFSAKEIMESARLEKAHSELRPGLQPHIYLHNVANIPPNSAKYRMFYKTDGGMYRLYRPHDYCHPARKGKTVPSREDLPPQYHHLLDWYERDYSNQANTSNDDDDPVLQMWGVGKEIWADEGGDAYIARERAEMDREMEGEGPNGPSQDDPLSERVWNRIIAHQGEEFHTIRGLPFKYSVEGNGIWFYRNGKRINQRLGRGEVDQAIFLCPVNTTTELNKFRNFAYLFALLRDRRIRRSDW